MGIFFSCLETKPCLQEHVSLTEKTCPCHGIKKRPIRLLIGGRGVRPRWIIPSQINLFLHTIRKPNSITVFIIHLKYFQALNKRISSQTFLSRQFPKIEFFFPLNIRQQVVEIHRVIDMRVSVLNPFNFLRVQQLARQRFRSSYRCKLERGQKKKMMGRERGEGGVRQVTVMNYP